MITGDYPRSARGVESANQDYIDEMSGLYVCQQNLHDNRSLLKPQEYSMKIILNCCSPEMIFL
jgi:hypothetical protein